jgi:hypothetical protein
MRKWFDSYIAENYKKELAKFKGYVSKSGNKVYGTELEDYFHQILIKVMTTLEKSTYVKTKEEAYKIIPSYLYKSYMNLINTKPNIKDYVDVINNIEEEVIIQKDYAGVILYFVKAFGKDRDVQIWTLKFNGYNYRKISQIMNFPYDKLRKRFEYVISQFKTYFKSMEELDNLIENHPYDKFNEKQLIKLNELLDSLIVVVGKSKEGREKEELHNLQIKQVLKSNGFNISLESTTKEIRKYFQFLTYIYNGKQ